MLWFEKLLPHGRKKVRATCEDSCGAGALARVIMQEREGIGHCSRSGELEFGEAH
jgi:hypothetical protein